jgi:Family of unknown function (DUF5684)
LTLTASEIRVEREVQDADDLVVRTALSRIVTTNWAKAVLAGMLLFALRSSAAEPPIPMLDTGTQVYSNVTITSKSATHVFIKHAKAADPKTTEPADAGENAMQKMAGSLDTKRFFPEGGEPNVTVDPDGTIRIEKNGHTVVIDKRALIVAASVLVFLYFFWSACSMAICRKCGVTGFFSGLLCWLGWFRLIPLLRAAGMSGWWFLVLGIPGVNVIIGVVWCIKIVNARGKGGFAATCLVFPPTFPLAFLYLALSGTGNDSGPTEEARPTHQKIQLRYQT